MFVERVDGQVLGRERLAVLMVLFRFKTASGIGALSGAAGVVAELVILRHRLVA